VCCCWRPASCHSGRDAVPARGALSRDGLRPQQAEHARTAPGASLPAGPLNAAHPPLALVSRRRAAGRLQTPLRTPRCTTSAPASRRPPPSSTTLGQERCRRAQSARPRPLTRCSWPRPAAPMALL
jgi:hypothetical protein